MTSMIAKHKVVGMALALCALAAGAQAATTKSGRGKAAAAPPQQPVELTGQVSRVIDGDTLWVRTAADTQPVIVRIEGIDAPESCQNGGGESTEALTRLVLNRHVTVRVTATDDHGRTVGKVFDGTVDVADRMVRDGHAWSMRFKYDRGPYIAEERMAQALKRGLHAEGGAELPRAFRQRNGSCVK
jgi:endonuclease YncB( thermonuclease family)